MVAHDFFAEYDNELTCRAGDVVEIVERVDSDWIRARRGFNEGLVPASFVQVGSSGVDEGVTNVLGSPFLAGASEPTTPVVGEEERRLRVLYDLEPECAGDLRLVAGTLLDFVAYGEDSNWMRARDPLTGQVGLCPASFVEEVKDGG